jgi:TPR repeat protein
LKSLSEEAQRLGFDTARFYLTYAMYKRGSANAEVTLAMLLAEGIGCESKPDTAYKLLESAISRGNSSAAEYLGREHLSGKIFKKSPELALKFFGKAAELGHSGAYEEMGDIYHAGEICEQDVARAIELYEMAAARGSLSADEKAKKLKTVRREYYLRGESIINRTGSVSADEAFGCFRSLAIATAMGEKCAPRLLAKCYAHGFGTEKDRATAFFWFERAVEVGDRNAYLPLALCYSRGFGTQFSYKKAVKYLKAAANAEYPGAAQELNTLYKRKMKKMVRSLYSTSVRLIYMRKYDEAARLLRSFESLAYPKALYTLGCLYEFGRGVDNSDRAMANKYYDMAYRGSSEFGSFDDKSSHYKLKLLKMIR